MAWPDQVRTVLRDLGAAWITRLTELGLDLQLADEPWKQALLGECRVASDRPEVQDFALEGAPWISPGLPPRSLLYHLLAAANAVPLLPAPTQPQIETLENCVYAAREFDLAALHAFVRQQFPTCRQPLTVVVFAYEYRAADETPHGRCADLCYSRTGAARVGTVAAPYSAELRGYPLIVADQPFAVPILPARYAAFIAVQFTGSDSFLGNYLQSGDDQRQFWVPVHKLFPGRECLQGLEVKLELQAYHVNEKLRRFHLHVHSQGIDTGRHQPEIDREPYIFTQQIAELAPDHGLGSRELMPTPHPKFVQPVEDERGPVTYWAPPLTNAVQDQECSAPLLRPGQVTGVDAECYPGPETIDAGHMFSAQQYECLYHRAEVIDLVSQGNYEARHFHDFTGDGWIAARVRFLGPDGRPARDPSQPLLCVSSPPSIAAYSLVCAPDFLPAVGQRALQERVKAGSLNGLQNNLWFAPPNSLADQRIAPNVELNHPHVHQTRIGPMFDPADDTVTAVVCVPFRPVTRPGNTNMAVRRNSYLPDQAAGLFSPGWDVGVDSKDDQAHLAMYSLGSPFPADSKLCAALSAFWPAVAPDTTRTFAPNQEHHQPTVVPLTDAEIGAGPRLPDGSRPAPWDGVAGPELLPGQDVVDYAALENADYVGQAWHHGFDISQLAQIDVEEYFQRLAAMFRVYKALGVPIDQPAPHNLLEAKAEWAVLSFQAVARGNVEMEQALAAAQPAGQTNDALFPLDDHRIYFFDVYKPQMDRITVSPHDPRRRRVPMQLENGKPIRRQFYVGTKALLMCDGDGKWRYEIFS